MTNICNSADQLAIVNAAKMSLDSSLLAEEFLYEKYRLRRNVLSNKVEFRLIEQPDSLYRPLTQEALSSIILRSRREGFEGELDIVSDLKLLVASEDIPAFDPAKDWLEGLEWDGKDRIAAFWQRIPGISVEQTYFLSIWMRSMVAHWLGVDDEHGNECVPTFIGAQGCGKSTFCIRMLPKMLRSYYMDNFNLGNKNDKNMALSDSLLICLDEMDQYKPGQQAELKQALSKTTVNGRKIYGRTHENRPRRASFVGTTNNKRPLQDATGSRRYLCILIPDGLLIDNITELDYEQIYAQLVNEVKEKERFWFTNEETCRIQELNAPFMQVHGLEKMVEFCIRPANEDEKESFLTTTQIAAEVLKLFPSEKKAGVSNTKVGLAMKALGYEKLHGRNGNYYSAVLINKE